MGFASEFTSLDMTHFDFNSALMLLNDPSHVHGSRFKPQLVVSWPGLASWLAGWLA